MTLPVRGRRRAELDIDEAFAWYELRGEGLGDALLRALEARFRRIVLHPESHVVAHGRVRRAPPSRPLPRRACPCASERHLLRISNSIPHRRVWRAITAMVFDARLPAQRAGECPRFSQTV